MLCYCLIVSAFMFVHFFWLPKKRPQKRAGKPPAIACGGHNSIRERITNSLHGQELPGFQPYHKDYLAEEKQLVQLGRSPVRGVFW
jgi:hypothetical protein